VADKSSFGNPEIECHATEGIADAGQIHLETNQEGPTQMSFHMSRAVDLSGSGIAAETLF